MADQGRLIVIDQLQVEFQVCLQNLTAVLTEDGAPENEFTLRCIKELHDLLEDVDIQNLPLILRVLGWPHPAEGRPYQTHDIHRFCRVLVYAHLFCTLLWHTFKCSITSISTLRGPGDQIWLTEVIHHAARGRQVAYEEAHHAGKHPEGEGERQRSGFQLNQSLRSHLFHPKFEWIRDGVSQDTKPTARGILSLSICSFTYYDRYATSL